MPTTPPPGDRRYVARHVFCDGRDAGLSLVETDGDTVRVSPFERETHSTVFVDTITVHRTAGGGSRIEITRR